MNEIRLAHEGPMHGIKIAHDQQHLIVPGMCQKDTDSCDNFQWGERLPRSNSGNYCDATGIEWCFVRAKCLIDGHLALIDNLESRTNCCTLNQVHHPIRIMPTPYAIP